MMKQKMRWKIVKKRSLDQEMRDNEINRREREEMNSN